MKKRRAAIVSTIGALSLACADSTKEPTPSNTDSKVIQTGNPPMTAPEVNGNADDRKAKSDSDAQEPKNRRVNPGVPPPKTDKTKDEQTETAAEKPSPEKKTEAQSQGQDEGK